MNAIRWFEIYVQDIQRAQKFYEEVFKFKLTPLDNTGELKMLSFPSDPNQFGCGGALVFMKGVTSGGNSTLVYFGSEDCAIEEARINSAGGKVVKPKMSIGPYGFITLASDTDGNMFGIHSMK